MENTRLFTEVKFTEKYYNLLLSRKFIEVYGKPKDL